MPLYECVIIARSDISQQQVNAILDGIASQVEADGGAIRKREYWGLRTLAYRIKKNRKGHYALLGIEAKPNLVQELERQLSLNEDILRQLTLRVETIDEAPSPILARKGEEKYGHKGRPSGGGGRFESGRQRRNNTSSSADKHSHGA